MCATGGGGLPSPSPEQAPVAMLFVIAYAWASTALAWSISLFAVEIAWLIAACTDEMAAAAPGGAGRGSCAGRLACLRGCGPRPGRAGGAPTPARPPCPRAPPGGGRGGEAG